MTHLIPLKSNEIVRVLERFGFRFHRQRGSHLIMVKEGSVCQPVIPMHSKELKKGTLRSIIRQAGLTPEEFFQNR